MLYYATEHPSARQWLWEQPPNLLPGTRHTISTHSSGAVLIRRRISQGHLNQPSPGVYFCGISCLYFTCIPAVCFSPYVLGIPLYPCIDLYLAILQQIHTVSHSIQLDPYVSSCI